MLRLFWPYLIVYVALTALGIRESFTDGPRPLPLAVIEILSAVLSVVGMLLYRFTDDVRKLATAWKVVFAFLVAEFAITSIVDFMEIAGDDEMPPALVIVVVAHAGRDPGLRDEPQARARPGARFEAVVVRNRRGVARGPSRSESARLALSIVLSMIAQPRRLRAA